MRKEKKRKKGKGAIYVCLPRQPTLLLPSPCKLGRLHPSFVFN